MDLKAIRNSKGLSQSELADAANITRQMISAIENGATPSVNTAKAIADKLNIDWQLFFQDNKTA